MINTRQLNDKYVRKDIYLEHLCDRKRCDSHTVEYYVVTKKNKQGLWVLA